MGERQRHRSLDALQPRRNAAPARRQRPRRADRHRVQRDAGQLPVGANNASFIFSTESGTILGWNGGSAATVEADRSPAGAVYKGLAIAQTPTGPRIYATDFHNGAVDVFDSAWQPVSHAGFIDPFLPRHFAPFGIQTIGDRIFVTYAKQQAGSDDEAHGRGLGIVDAFDTAGRLAPGSRNSAT